MHNEVDGGLSWTNMGVKPVTIFSDTYIKSMRMCYNIVRQYDEHAEVFASFHIRGLIFLMWDGILVKTLLIC